jgi:hypothetical protein
MRRSSRPAKKLFVDQINEVADEVNKILDKRQKEKYFESITLLYSFIENVLKWLVFAQALWVRAKDKITAKDYKSIREFAKNLTFYNTSNIAYTSGLIDDGLFMRISEARNERNKIIHKFWTYERRGNKAVMRKKLEKLARISNDLVGVFNRLVKNIGVDEIYDLTL